MDVPDELADVHYVVGGEVGYVPKTMNKYQNFIANRNHGFVSWNVPDVDVSLVRRGNGSFFL